MGDRADRPGTFPDGAATPWFAASPQSSESFGVCSAPPTVGVVDASVLLDIPAPLKSNRANMSCRANRVKALLTPGLEAGLLRRLWILRVPARISGNAMLKAGNQ